MLDVVRELMPLLEGAKNGTVWLVAAYFGLLLARMLLVAGVIIWLASRAYRLIMAGMRDPIEVNRWAVYQWNTNGPEGRINAHFKQKDFQDLLRAIACPRGYVLTRDIQELTAKVKEWKGRA